MGLGLLLGLGVGVEGRGGGGGGGPGGGAVGGGGLGLPGAHVYSRMNGALSRIKGGQCWFGGDGVGCGLGEVPTPPLHLCRWWVEQQRRRATFQREREERIRAEARAAAEAKAAAEAAAAAAAAAAARPISRADAMRAMLTSGRGSGGVKR